MKKILYVDTYSPIGHVVFNRIQLNALVDLNCKVYYVFQSKYAEKIGIEKIHKFIELPGFICYNRNSKITHRVLGVFHLLLIYLKSMFYRIDAVIFSYYDPVSLFFFPFKSKVFLFNHTNIAKLSNPVFRWFTKHLPKQYTHLVFNDHMQEGLEKYGITNVQQQQHEPVEPYTSTLDVRALFSIPEQTKVIFSPSATSVDNDFIQSIISDQTFVEFLADNELTLVLKGKYYMEKPSSSVVIIDRYLSGQEYQSLFVAADIIFLPYETTFKYRVSGILFSVFASNKKVLVSDVEGIKAYQSRFNYNPFFKNKEQLKKQIITVLNLSETVELYNFNPKTTKETWITLLN
jgi:hypothetical protein